MNRDRCSYRAVMFHHSGLKAIDPIEIRNDGLVTSTPRNSIVGELFFFSDN